jgi:hypothetical protein
MPVRNERVIQPQTQKSIRVSAAELAAITGTNTGSLVLDSLPAGQAIEEAAVIVHTPVAGTSITAATVQLAVNSANLLANAANVFIATRTNYRTNCNVSKTANADITLVLTTTGANMSAINAGDIEIVLKIVPILV